MEDVELLGLFIDLEKMKGVEEKLRKRLAEIEKKFLELIGRKINWDSPAQVAEILYGTLGLTPTVLTPKGKPSTNEEALAGIKGKHPVANLIVDYRETQKFLSTYIGGESKKGKGKVVGWKPFMVGNKLYLSSMLHGTVTGRYSNRLHQVPRDGTIRNLIVPWCEGKFVQLDYATAEMRIAAILSECPELLRCFRTGIDVHWRTLISVIASGGGEYVKPALDTAYKLDHSKHLTLSRALKIILKAGPNVCIKLWKPWYEARKKAKAINFGFVFGMYEKKFIEQSKIKYGFEPTWDEAHLYRETYFETYPGLLPWHDKQKKLARINGQVRSLAGRVRRLPGIYSSDWKVRKEAERQAINAPVQGFIGDLKVMGMEEISEKFPHVGICGEHHDALLTIFDNLDVDKYLLDVMQVMENPRLLKELKVDLPIRMVVEATVGPCWGKGETFVVSDNVLVEV